MSQEHVPYVPGFTPADASPIDEDAILAYTLRQRALIIEQIAPAGKMPVADTKQMGVILQTLDGMDRTALGKKRIKADESIAKSNGEVAATMAAVLKMTSSAKPFLADGTESPRIAPKLGVEVPSPVLVAGETSVGGEQQSIESFKAADASSKG